MLNWMRAIRDLMMKVGAAGFLNKPVRSDTLLKEINAALVKAKTDIHPLIGSYEEARYGLYIRARHQRRSLRDTQQ